MVKSHLGFRLLLVSANQAKSENLFRQTLYIFNVDLNVKCNPVVVNCC